MTSFELQSILSFQSVKVASSLLLFALSVTAPGCWSNTTSTTTDSETSVLTSQTPTSESLNRPEVEKKLQLTSDSKKASTSGFNTIQDLSERSAELVRRTAPCMVKISIERDQLEPDEKSLESFFGQIPRLKSQDIGSGFFVQLGGFVVSNYHVVRNAKSINVKGSQGDSWVGKVIAFDAASDLAVIKVECNDHSCVVWGDSNSLNPGNLVWIGGSPYGLESSFSLGIISSLGRSWMDGSPLRDYIQTDAAINPGTSGGPMLDAEGRVVGVASAILGDQNQGIGFALPSAIATKVVAQLIENRKAVRGWIGAQLGTVTPERAKKASLASPSGAFIEQIDSHSSDSSPSKKGGLLVGDICTECNDIKIVNPYDLARLIAFSNPGDVLHLRVWRAEKTISLSILVALRP